MKWQVVAIKFSIATLIIPPTKLEMTQIAVIPLEMLMHFSLLHCQLLFFTNNYSSL